MLKLEEMKTPLSLILILITTKRRTHSNIMMTAEIMKRVDKGLCCSISSRVKARMMAYCWKASQSGDMFISKKNYISKKTILEVDRYWKGQPIDGTPPKTPMTGQMTRRCVTDP